MVKGKAFTFLVMAFLVGVMILAGCSQQSNNAPAAEAAKSQENASVEKNDDSKAEPLGLKEYKVAVQDLAEYMPESEYKDGQYSGYARELLDLFAEKAGIKFTYVVLSLKRQVTEFVNGGADFKYPDNKNWSPEEKQGKEVIYSNNVWNSINCVVVQSKKENMKIDELKKMGIITGFTPFQYMDSIKEGRITVAENSDIKGLMQQVLEGRVDGAYMNPVVIDYYFEKYFQGRDKLVFAKGLPYAETTRHLSTIKYPELINKFNAFLESEKAAINELKKKYNIPLD
ncbi:MAG: transporter substrate-binding domain-containing protein [Clostridia bacterium]|nr:transporter substrate-binding domain-containing protein [Clostridia bacterium]